MLKKFFLFSMALFLMLNVPKAMADDLCPCSTGQDGQCPIANDGMKCCCDPDCMNSPECSAMTDCPCNTGSGCDIRPDGSGLNCPCDPDCSNSLEYTYSWSTGPWSECSNGVQTRIVSCQKSDGSMASDSSCDASKPEISQSCIASNIDNNCPCSNGPTGTCHLAEDGKPCCCGIDCMNTDKCLLMLGENQCPTSVDSNGCPDSAQKDCYKNQCLQRGGRPYESTMNGCVFIECDESSSSDSCPCSDGANNICSKSLMGDTDCCCDPDCAQSPNCAMPVPISACPCDDGIKTSCPASDSALGGPCCCDADCFNKQECSQTGNIDPNCRQIIDDKGITRVICENQIQPTNCPTGDEMARMKMKCVENNGNPIIIKDPRGCEFVDCRFNNMGNGSMFQNIQCPNENDLMQAMEKCKSLGYEPKIYFDQGCKFVNCAQESDIYCPEIQSREEINSLNCEAQGLILGKDYDLKGCPIYKCLEPDYCRTEIPEEAIIKCKEFGGEMISTMDPKGCISFFKCVQRGESSNSYIAPITEVPDATKLMQVALSLDTLVMKLDELARKTSSIADYYASTGSLEEARFRRVSGMFKGVIEKVNSIKSGIRDNLRDMTVEYLEKVKQDIKYIKDVVLMDIVYVMLSSPEDYEIEESNATIFCNSDECFNKYYRICQPATIEMEGGFEVKIIGLEDYKCLAKVTLPEDKAPKDSGISPPYEMSCAKQDYSMGFNTKEDVEKYCEGNLVQIIALDKGESE